ncbi:MAG: helix-turn-helix domain-containing protein [Lachnospiraceae bacterium]
MNTEKLLEQVMCLIEENLNERLTIPYIADRVYISAVHLQRLFKQQYGVTIAAYIRTRKLHLAADEVVNTGKRIDEIGYDLEFGHESSFIRSFKREFGITPNEMRRMNQKTA